MYAYTQRFQQRPEVTFHDPLAAVSLFDDQVCAFERGQDDVELASTHLSGMTYFTAQSQGPHEVAMKVEPERFFAEYFGVTAGA